MAVCRAALYSLRWPTDHSLVC